MSKRRTFEMSSHYDKDTGEHLEYWPCDGESIKKHGFHLMDKDNSELGQVWLTDKQAKMLAVSIINSVTRDME